MSERSVARSEEDSFALLGTGFAISYNKIEERMKNGVKNLKGARLFPKTFSNYGFEDTSSLHK
jgi:hypothetical protein